MADLSPAWWESSAAGPWTVHLLTRSGKHGSCLRMSWTFCPQKIAAGRWLHSKQLRIFGSLPTSCHPRVCLLLKSNESSCCRKGDPFQGTGAGSCLTLKMSCPRRRMCWQSKRLYWEEAARWRAARGPKRTAFSRGSQSWGVCGNGVSFWVVSGQSFWLRVLPDGARVAHPRWIPARRILGGL